MESQEKVESRGTDGERVTEKPPPETDEAYEDDFEEEDKDKSANGNSSENNSSPLISSSDPSDQEKGQVETSGDAGTEKVQLIEQKDDHADSQEPSRAKPSLSPYDEAQSDDSEPEPEDDPPEYNVKERVKQLNEELAAEPEPDDRAHRVGFKADLVDLVAPPPDQDDDDSPRKTLADPEDTRDSTGDTRGGDGEGGDKKDKQFVVERDGKFDVVADQDLTATERAMFNMDAGGDSPPEPAAPPASDSSSNANNSNSSAAPPQPSPPSKPRPNTAAGYQRRAVRPSQSPRPQTAGSSSPSRQAGGVGHRSALDNFNYTSEYAMSPSEKERAQQRARLRDQQRKEEEALRKQEEEYKRAEAEDCFQAWLARKRDDDSRRRQEEDERKRRGVKDDRSEESESKESEEAFQGWLQEKQGQVRRDKLLKRREDQEIKDGYYVRSRDECDQAYKEWLKKKYAELRRQKMAEKQRQKSFRTAARRSRKQQQMARAVRQSEAFRYVDYYGYRF